MLVLIDTSIFSLKEFTDALEDHQGTVSICGRIDGLAGSEQELENLVKQLDILHSLRYGNQCKRNKSNE